MGAPSLVLEQLRAIKERGVYVGIDDFGTGHSSLARLRELPVEVLKVDRSFIDGLGTEREDSAVVAAVLSLAHALGLHVIAEGVETPLQAHQLIALGCPVAQGWLWSPAVPADQIPPLMGTNIIDSHPRDRRPPRRHEPDRRDDAPAREAPMTGIDRPAHRPGLHGPRDHHRLRAGPLSPHARLRHFGAAFAVMAFTCGPHHLVHAWRHLVSGEQAHGPMTAALVLGVGPALVFIGLRLEAVLGGRGDRLIPSTPMWVHVLPLAAATAAGATAVGGAAPRPDDAAVDPARADPEPLPVRQLRVRRPFIGAHAGRAPPAARRLVAVGPRVGGVFLTCASRI